MIGVWVPWSEYSGVRSGWSGYVIDGDGCHIWTGYRNPDGYAIATIKKGSKRGSAAVYRVRYEREIGPVPPGMQLDHYVCNNGAGGCCNPRHCRPVTARENVLRSDGVAAKRRARTHCPNGHAYTDENITSHSRRHGLRRCLACARECSRLYMRRKRLRARELGL